MTDVNHRFVHTWFGGESELLVAVLKDQLCAFAEAVPGATPGILIRGFLDPDVVSLVRLAMWLNLEGVDSIDPSADRAIVAALTTRDSVNL